jgi:hypothetical protein
MTNCSDLSVTLNNFIERLPTFPLCTDSFTNGSAHKPREVALKRDYIQFNPHHYQQALAFDVDREYAFEAWEDANLPRPSFITLSKNGNGHAHLVYVFKTPIATHDHARFQPMRWAAAIERGFTRRLGADRGYAGLLTKNPLTHDTIATGALYDLLDLDARLDYSDKAPDYKRGVSQGLGRNVEMFDTVRFDAYREVSSFNSFDAFNNWVIQRCESVNSGFETPLPMCEPRATAKSVACWTYKNRHKVGGHYKNKGAMMLDMVDDMDLKERQQAGAEYTNKVQRERTQSAIQQAYTLIAKLGKKPTQNAIAEHTGLSLRTVKTYWKNIKK